MWELIRGKKLLCTFVNCTGVTSGRNLFFMSEFNFGIDETECALNTAGDIAQHTVDVSSSEEMLPNTLCSVLIKY